MEGRIVKELNHPRDNTSAVTIPLTMTQASLRSTFEQNDESSPRAPIPTHRFILLFSGILLRKVFDVFGDLHVVFENENVFAFKCELECEFKNVNCDFDFYRYGDLFNHVIIDSQEVIFISAIRLTIAIIFGCLLTLLLRELLNCEFELEKSSLSNEYDIVCDALTSPTIDTLFNFNLRGVGLGEFNNSRCNSSAVLTVSTMATIITNENKNEMIFNTSSYWGQYTQAQTQTQTIYPTAPAIDNNDKIGLTGARLAKFNNVACVFGGVSCENDFYYDVNNIFDDYYDNDIIDGYLVCLFLLFFFGMSSVHQVTEWSLGALLIH